MRGIRHGCTLPAMGFLVGSVFGLSEFLKVGCTVPQIVVDRRFWRRIVRRFRILEVSQCGLFRLTCRRSR
ncbi:hypothetical protein FRAHR75_350073 [Frankia sp. Hr75.2]|nr:hypothetical protein FRAHR75_350073 [Frankia sp. Hr75.2]